jgi:formylglycine-generating enzyme required for sulfatase activity
MTFRAVGTRANPVLGEQRIVLGAPDASRGFSEFSRHAHIAGAFALGSSDTHSVYWMGKYEVTTLQLKAVDGNCVAPTLGERRPASSVNWFEAARFAHRYTEWLYTNAIDTLPSADGVPGFLRLPTETEWEFATRGGIVVNSKQFGGPTFPVPDGLRRYVWHDGPESAGGKARLTGLLRPNPLGLFDVLGNVEEIVLEPYRLHRVVRLHGKPGGFTTKGGHYFTSPSHIRSAYRREYSHFDATTKRPTSVATIGFRLAIGALAVPTHSRLDEIRKAWSKLPRAIMR